MIGASLTQDGHIISNIVPMFRERKRGQSEVYVSCPTSISTAKLTAKESGKCSFLSGHIVTLKKKKKRASVNIEAFC